MNYLCMHHTHGAPSIAKIIPQMMQPIMVVAKKSRNHWVKFSKDIPEWETIEHPEETLRDGTPVINWGNRIFDSDDMFKVNSPSAIRNAVNKPHCRILLQKNGISVPYTTLDPNELEYPYIARPQTHYAGQHFHFVCCDMAKEYMPENRDGWYYSKVFPKTREYRVHVAHNRVLMIHEKTSSNQGELNPRHDSSWEYIGWDRYNPDMCTMCIDAMNVVNLDYGAIDVMFNDNDCVITEINTNPDVSFSPYMSKKYANYFDWLIRNDFPDRFEPNGEFVFKSAMLEA